MKVVEVRIEDLRLPPNVPAGMNYLLLGFFAYQLRATNKSLEPILVERVGDGSFRITDGRHRAIAALIAGRPSVDAVIQERH
jgi:hypothetical protein